MNSTTKASTITMQMIVSLKSSTGIKEYNTMYLSQCCWPIFHWALRRINGFHINTILRKKRLGNGIRHLVVMLGLSWGAAWCHWQHSVTSCTSLCFSPWLQVFQLYLQVLRLFHLFIQRPLQLPGLVMGLIELDAQYHIVSHTHTHTLIIYCIYNTFIFNISIDPKFTQRTKQEDCCPFF